MGAPIGNQNAANAKVWKAAVMRALEETGADRKKAIDSLAAALIEKGLSGDVSALKEIGDRVDGKPGQSMVLQGDENHPLVTRIERAIVHVKDTDG
jgi:hypothetical protein